MGLANAKVVAGMVLGVAVGLVLRDVTHARPGTGGSTDKAAPLRRTTAGGTAAGHGGTAPGQKTTGGATTGLSGAASSYPTAGRTTTGQAAGGATTGGSPAPDEDTTADDVHQLRLLDKHGKVQVVLEGEEDGSAGILFGANARKPRIKLSATVDGSPSISLLDGNDRRRVQMGLLPNGDCNLSFSDPSGKQRVFLGLKKDATQGLILQSKTGRAQAAIVVSPEGVPAIIPTK